MWIRKCRSCSGVQTDILTRVTLGDPAWSAGLRASLPSQPATTRRIELDTRHQDPPRWPSLQEHHGAVPEPERVAEPDQEPTRGDGARDDVRNAEERRIQRLIDEASQLWSSVDAPPAGTSSPSVADPPSQFLRITVSQRRSPDPERAEATQQRRPGAVMYCTRRTGTAPRRRHRRPLADHDHREDASVSCSSPYALAGGWGGHGIGQQGVR
jgi:hypothetical protein